TICFVDVACSQRFGFGVQVRHPCLQVHLRIVRINFQRIEIPRDRLLVLLSTVMGITLFHEVFQTLTVTNEGDVHENYYNGDAPHHGPQLWGMKPKNRPPDAKSRESPPGYKTCVGFW